MNTSTCMKLILSLALVAPTWAALVGCRKTNESSVKDVWGMPLDIDKDGPIPLVYLDEATRMVHFAICPRLTENINRNCQGIHQTQSPISEEEFERRLNIAIMRESTVSQLLQRETVLEIGGVSYSERIRKEIAILDAKLTPTQREYLRTPLSTDDALRLLLTDGDKERLLAIKLAVREGQDLVLDEFDKDYLSLFMHVSHMGDMVPFVAIQGGTYLMGSPVDEAGRDDRYEEQVLVTVDDFEMMTTEMTNQAFASLDRRLLMVNTVNFDPKKVDMRKHVGFSIRRLELALGYLNAQRDGYHYSLPSDEIWEYAARGGTSGPIYGDLDKIAWCGSATGDSTPLPGLKEPNVYGLYDMIGGSWEVVSRSALRPPPRRGYSSEWTFAPHLIMRGGAWTSQQTTDCRAAAQVFLGQVGHDAMYRKDQDIGFRLIRTPIRDLDPVLTEK